MTLARTMSVAVLGVEGQLVEIQADLADAWVWDVYRSALFVKTVRVVTFKDVNVEELAKAELDLGSGGAFPR